MNNAELFEKLIRESFELGSDFDVKTIKRGETDNWDSIGHMVLIENIESSFDIMMDPEDILELDSYECGIQILSKYGVDI